MARSWHGFVPIVVDGNAGAYRDNLTDQTKSYGEADEQHKTRAELHAIRRDSMRAAPEDAVIQEQHRYFSRPDGSLV